LHSARHRSYDEDHVRNLSVSLSFTLIKNEKVEQYIRIKDP